MCLPARRFAFLRQLAASLAGTSIGSRPRNQRRRLPAEVGSSSPPCVSMAFLSLRRDQTTARLLRRRQALPFVLGLTSVPIAPSRPASGSDLEAKRGGSDARRRAAQGRGMADREGRRLRKQPAQAHAGGRRLRVGDVAMCSTFQRRTGVADLYFANAGTVSLSREGAAATRCRGGPSAGERRRRGPRPRRRARRRRQPQTVHAGHSTRRGPVLPGRVRSDRPRGPGR